MTGKYVEQNEGNLGGDEFEIIFEFIAHRYRQYASVARSFTFVFCGVTDNSECLENFRSKTVSIEGEPEDEEFGISCVARSFSDKYTVNSLRLRYPSKKIMYVMALVGEL